MILILCMSILILIIAILMLNNDVYNNKIKLEILEQQVESIIMLKKIGNDLDTLEKVLKKEKKKTFIEECIWNNYDIVYVKDLPNKPYEPEIQRKKV